MKQILKLILVALIGSVAVAFPSHAADLSDTQNPIVSIKLLSEPELGPDYASIQIDYKDDKNLFKGLNGCYQGILCLIPDMVQNVIASDAAPVCKAFQFYPTNAHGLNLLTAAEDLTKRVQNASGVQQTFILRFSTKLYRPDNGCKYQQGPLQLVWWIDSFDIRKGISKFGDEAGNGAHVIGVPPRLGDYSTPAVLFPVTASVKLANSYCGFIPEDIKPYYSYTECILKNYSKIYKTPSFYQLNISDVQKTGLFNAVKTSAKDLGEFNESTYAFASFKPSVTENVRLIASASMAISNPNFPSYQSTKIEDAIYRMGAYEKLQKLADLSQEIDLVATWNEWVQKTLADKAAADKAAADKAAADKAAADKAAADKAAADKAAADKAAADKAAAAKKSTITCSNGKLIKKVTGVKPKCPTGYKKK